MLVRAVVENKTKGIYFNRFGKDYHNLLKKNIYGGNFK